MSALIKLSDSNSLKMKKLVAYVWIIGVAFLAFKCTLWIPDLKDKIVNTDEYQLFTGKISNHEYMSK